MSHWLALIISLSPLFLLPTAAPTTIGVTYIPSPTLPPPEQVVAALKDLKITAVRLPVAEPSVIRAFSNTNISLFLSIPNNLIPSISANRSAASFWIYNHVVPFYPRALITAISVGTNVIADADVSSTDLIVPALRNVHQTLRDLGLSRIAVSTTLSFVNIMSTYFPPSSAEFQEPVNNLILTPLLDFLTETNSPFFVSLYPYNVYRLRPEIPIGFALFQQHAYDFRDDTLTGVRYQNLFDVMADGVISAMAVSGYENIPMVVTETGWPCSDPSNEAEASDFYAAMYLQGLVNHLRSGTGTPLRKEGVAEVYIYEMFDTNDTRTNNQSGTGQNWGFLHPNMSMKFEIDFSVSGGATATGAVMKVILGLPLLVSVLAF